MIEELFTARAAIGAALTLEQQIFVSEHWRDLPAWLGTDAGREAVRLVVGEWQQSAAPRGD